jgi:cardiolipin-specific phospholipase
VNGLALISPVGLPSPPKDSISLPSKPLSLSFLLAAWSINVTPQSIIRFLGPRGKSYVHNAISRRFSAKYSSGVHWNSEEADMISEYMYHITVAEPSGEYSMNSLLTPIYYAKRIKSRDPREPDSIKVSGSVYAREPLLEDLAKCLKQSSSHKKVVPLLIQFGDNDWLSYENVESDINYLKNHHGIEAQLDIIKSAGHHLYLENPTDFSASLSNLKNKYGL